MTPAIDILLRRNIIRRGKVDASIVARLRRASLAKIVEEMAAAHEDTDTFDRRVPHVEHSTSLSLGAHIGGCHELSCRLKAAEKLCQFALLCSDRVHISDFFDYCPNCDIATRPLEDLRIRFYNDVSVLLALRPLTEAGLITLAAPPFQVCSQHAGQLRLIEKRMSRAEQLLTKRYEDSITDAVLKKTGEHYFLACRGPETLLHEGFQGWENKGPPPMLDSMPQITKRLQRDGMIPLSRNLIKKFKIPRRLARSRTHNAQFGLMFSELRGTSFVTDQDVDLEVASAISGDAELATRNSILAQHLTSLIPFLGGASPRAIAKLRKEESDAFFAYRGALRTTIQESCHVSKRFTRTDAQQLYADVLQPELASLTRRVAKARRRLISQPAREFVGLLGVMTFGVYAGILTPEVITAAAIGGVYKGAKFVKQVLDIQDAEESISDHPLYFLWKVQRKCAR